MNAAEALRDVAGQHGWQVEEGKRGNAPTLHFTKGPLYLRVAFTASGGVGDVRVGKTGGHQLTGRGKREQAISLLARWEQEAPKPKLQSLTLEQEWALRESGQARMNRNCYPGSS